VERIEAGEVEQITDGDERVTLYKEVNRLRGDVPLCLVRKHLPGGPTRPPVLLVHGFAQNRYSWHTSVRSPSAWLAARGWDVWNLELRGHGRSRSAGTSGAERFADYVDDVRRAASALPGRAFWIGHSLGGAAIYGASTQIAPSAAPRGVVGIGAIYKFGQANTALNLLGRATHALRDTPMMQRLQVRTGLVGTLLSRLYAVSDVAGYAFPVSGWWPGSIEPALLEERLINGFDWTSVRVWQEMSRWAATGEFEYDGAWRQTTHPLLVILGDEDHLMPPDDGRVAYDRSGSDDRTLLVLDDWKHGVHWGHLDLVLGRRAREVVWTAIADWMVGRAG